MYCLVPEPLDLRAGGFVVWWSSFVLVRWWVGVVWRFFLFFLSCRRVPDLIHILEE